MVIGIGVDRFESKLKELAIVDHDTILSSYVKDVNPGVIDDDDAEFEREYISGLSALKKERVNEIAKSLINFRTKHHRKWSEKVLRRDNNGVLHCRSNK